MGGEHWMGIWIGTFIGVFIIAVAIYDYFSRKKRNQEIKLWKYFLAIIVGLAFAFPIVSGIVLWILGGFVKIKMQKKGSKKCIAQPAP